MLLTLSSQKLKLQELIRQRKPLSVRFEANPKDTHLALELKSIDDQIAECNQVIQAHRRK